MRQAIITKYFGPTNHRGSRIKATSGSGLVVWSGYRSELNSDENHKAAAMKLASKYEWDKFNKYIGGSTPTGYCFVAVPKKKGK